MAEEAPAAQGDSASALPAAESGLAIDSESDSGAHAGPPPAAGDIGDHDPAQAIET